MDPLVLRAAFRPALLIAAVALVILPFEDRASAEFVVTVMALAVGCVFLAAIALLARLGRMPARRDKRGMNGYNRRNPTRGGDR